jgi:hypothetical protein
MPFLSGSHLFMFLAQRNTGRDFMPQRTRLMLNFSGECCENIALLRHRSYDLLAKNAKDVKIAKAFKNMGTSDLPSSWRPFVLGVLGENHVCACLNRINFHSIYLKKFNINRVLCGLWSSLRYGSHAQKRPDTASGPEMGNVIY